MISWKSLFVHQILYRVFIKYCVFSKVLKYSRLLPFSVCLGVSVCTPIRQVKHQRCSRTGRVQKNHNILSKKDNIEWTPCIKPFFNGDKLSPKFLPVCTVVGPESKILIKNKSSKHPDVNSYVKSKTKNFSQTCKNSF